MKHYIASVFLIFAVCYFIAIPLRAQEGLVFSVHPPIVVRIDGKIYFTYTSDKVLHGITVNDKGDNGKKIAKIIIDTHDAHKTLEIDSIPEPLFNDPALTCTNYSNPLPVNLLNK